MRESREPWGLFDFSGPKVSSRAWHTLGAQEHVLIYISVCEKRPCAFSWERTHGIGICWSQSSFLPTSMVCGTPKGDRNCSSINRDFVLGILQTHSQI